MTTISLVLFMLLAVVVSGFVARMLPRQMPVPLPLIQIALGAMIAQMTSFTVQLDPQIFFLLFLPPLLFLDGWRLPRDAIRRDKWTILELALGLVVFTVVGMGFLINWMIPAIPLGVAFALAAVLSPTDPVAVSAIGSRVPMPKRLMHILEGESLLNDASGLVCLRFAVAAALTGTFSLPDAARTFVWLAVGGVAIGILTTLITTTVKTWIAQRFGEESGTQILISLLIPFGAYLMAEHAHASGILAAVAAGVTMGYVESQGKVKATTRVRRNVVWDTLQFAANGAIFVLLGEQMPQIFDGALTLIRGDNMHTAWWLAVYVVGITAALAVLRFAWVWTSVRFTMFTALKHGGHKGAKERAEPVHVPLRLVAVVSVAGVRGAITLAGILTLPLLMTDGTPFPARDLVIFLAAGVIVLSLILATVALPPLVKGLELPPEEALNAEEELARTAAALAAIHAIEKALHELSEKRSDADMYAAAAVRVMGVYRRKLDDIAKTGDDKNEAYLILQIERHMRMVGLQAEREEIFRLGRVNEITDEVARRLVREIDLLESHQRA